MKTKVSIQSVRNSSTVVGIGHSPDTKELFIKFSSGVIYKYTDITDDIITDLVAIRAIGNMGTKSPVGKFINDHVKGVFDYEKVEQPSDDYEFVISKE